MDHGSRKMTHFHACGQRYLLFAEEAYVLLSVAKWTVIRQERLLINRCQSLCLASAPAASSKNDLGFRASPITRPSLNINLGCLFFSQVRTCQTLSSRVPRLLRLPGGRTLIMYTDGGGVKAYTGRGRPPSCRSKFSFPPQDAVKTRAMAQPCPTGRCFYHMHTNFCALVLRNV